MTDEHERLAYEARQAMQGREERKIGDIVQIKPGTYPSDFKWPQHREAKIASHLPAGLLGWLW